MLVMSSHHLCSADEREASAQVVASLTGIRMDDHCSILAWIQASDPRQYELGEYFPRNEIRQFFQEAGYTAQITRLQSLRVGNKEEHAKRIICFWVHQIKQVKRKPPAYNAITDALAEWFERYKKEE